MGQPLRLRLWRGDRDAARRAFLERYGDRPILVLGTHFATPSAGRIVRDGNAWRLEI
jgi:hypothetical protein